MKRQIITSNQLLGWLPTLVDQISLDNPNVESLWTLGIREKSNLSLNLRFDLFPNLVNSQLKRSDPPKLEVNRPVDIRMMIFEIEVDLLVHKAITNKILLKIYPLINCLTCPSKICDLYLMNRQCWKLEKIVKKIFKNWKNVCKSLENFEKT